LEFPLYAVNDQAGTAVQHVAKANSRLQRPRTAALADPGALYRPATLLRRIVSASNRALSTSTNVRAVCSARIFAKLCASVLAAAILSQHNRSEADILTLQNDVRSTPNTGHE
jgi:hypothetical protein